MKSRLTEVLLSFLRHNTIALVALFVALSGTAYAVTALPPHSVGTKQLKDGAVTSAKVKDNAIKGRDVLESSLAKVPSAAKADTAATLGGIGPGVFGSAVWYAGIDFHPRESTTAYTYFMYQYLGGMVPKTPNAVFYARLTLPQGATATQITLHAVHEPGILSLMRFPGGEFEPALATAGLGARVGSTTTYSVDIVPPSVIDNSSYAYELQWISPEGTSVLMGARVDYTLP
jgi:hypothetical protein